MERCQIKEIKCPQFVIKLQQNPVSLDAFDQDMIPDEYKKVVVDIDTQKIKDDLKNGVVIPGARLVQGNHVRIK